MSMLNCSKMASLQFARAACLSALFSSMLLHHSLVSSRKNAAAKGHFYLFSTTLAGVEVSPPAKFMVPCDVILGHESITYPILQPSCFRVHPDTTPTHEILLHVCTCSTSRTHTIQYFVQEV
jgi:hypothetical protein